LAAAKLRPATMASHVVDLLDDDDGIEEEVDSAVESIEDAMEGSGLSPEARQEEPPPPLKTSPTPDLGAELVQHEHAPEELSVAQVAEIWSELMSMRGGETTTKQLHGHTLRYQRRSADRGGDWYLHHGSEADRARPSQGRTTRSRLQFLKQFKLTSDELDAAVEAHSAATHARTEPATTPPKPPTPPPKSPTAAVSPPPLPAALAELPATGVAPAPAQEPELPSAEEEEPAEPPTQSQPSDEEVDHSPAPMQVVHPTATVRRAEAIVTEKDGVRLHLNPSAATGYKGVSLATGRQQGFRVQARDATGRQTQIGLADNAVDAAVIYARYMAPPPPPDVSSGAEDTAMEGGEAPPPRRPGEEEPESSQEPMQPAATWAEAECAPAIPACVAEPAEKQPTSAADPPAAIGVAASTPVASPLQGLTPHRDATEGQASLVTTAEQAMLPQADADIAANGSLTWLCSVCNTESPGDQERCINVKCNLERRLHGVAQGEGRTRKPTVAVEARVEAEAGLFGQPFAAAAGGRGRSQCEKNPFCWRGFKHLGRGGQCSVDSALAARRGSEKAVAAARVGIAAGPSVANAGAKGKRRQGTTRELDRLTRRPYISFGDDAPERSDGSRSLRHNPSEEPSSPRSKRQQYRGTILGRRVTVYWEGDDKFFAGKVAEYSESSGEHLVSYDDGDQKYHPLDGSGCVWMFEEEDAQVDESEGARKRRRGHSGAAAPALSSASDTALPPGWSKVRHARGAYGGGGGWYYSFEGPLGAKARTSSQAWSIYRKDGGAERRGDSGTAQHSGMAQHSNGDQRNHFATKTGRPVHETTAAEKETRKRRRHTHGWSWAGHSGPRRRKEPAPSGGETGGSRDMGGGSSSSAALRQPRTPEALVSIGPRKTQPPGRGSEAAIGIGPAHQARLPRLTAPSVRAPPAPPPLCACASPAPTVWLRGRWWCARELSCGGCSFESEVPPAELPRTPLCECGRAAMWLRERWCCARTSREGGCGLDCAADRIAMAAIGCAPEVREEPRRVEAADMEVEQARQTAALLTAVALGGDVEYSCFVAPSDCGLGLYARSNLGVGQLVGEYGGPRLPLRAANGGYLKHSEYALTVTGTHGFIDGKWENAAALGLLPAGAVEQMPVTLAVYANHSTRPNARFERREGGGLGPLDLRQRMYIVATEPIEAGREIRVDYESGSASYWGARGLEMPTETSWRSAWVQPPPPPPNGPEAPPWMASQMVALHALRGGRLGADGLGRQSGTWEAGAGPPPSRLRSMLLVLSFRGACTQVWGGDGEDFEEDLCNVPPVQAAIGLTHRPAALGAASPAAPHQACPRRSMSMDSSPGDMPRRATRVHEANCQDDVDPEREQSQLIEKVGGQVVTAPGPAGKLPWGGPGGVKERLAKLHEALYRNNPTNWSTIASHLPGWSGAQCRAAWDHIAAEREPSEDESDGQGQDEGRAASPEWSWWEWQKPPNTPRPQTRLRATLSVGEGGFVSLSLFQHAHGRRWLPLDGSGRRRWGAATSRVEKQRNNLAHTCSTCGKEHPDALADEDVALWVQCDACHAWSHAVCVGLSDVPDAHLCPSCTTAGRDGAAPDAATKKPKPSDDAEETLNWVQCERCSKWRRLPAGAPEPAQDQWWDCSMNPDPQRNRCDVEEQADSEDEDGEDPDTPSTSMRHAQGGGKHAGSRPRDRDQHRQQRQAQQQQVQQQQQPQRQHKTPKKAGGLALHLSTTSATGYRGVRLMSNGRFQASIWGSRGESRSLGCFDTAVEAAICFARQVQREAERKLRRRLAAGPDGVASSSSAASVAPAAVAATVTTARPPAAQLPAPPPLLQPQFAFPQRDGISASAAGSIHWPAASQQPSRGLDGHGFAMEERTLLVSMGEHITLGLGLNAQNVVVEMSSDSVAAAGGVRIGDVVVAWQGVPMQGRMLTTAIAEAGQDVRNLQGDVHLTVLRPRQS